MQWFYIRNEQRFGPIGDDEFFRLARAGQLSPNDQVWNSTMGAQWMPASSVPNLFALSANPSPGVPGATSNRDLMGKAIESLRGKWALAVGVTLLYNLVMGGGQFVLQNDSEIFVQIIFALVYVLIIFIIAGPMLLGWTRFFLKIARRESSDVGQLFNGFKMFGKTLITYFLMFLYTFLWSLLLIIPGIIAAIAYSQTFFILSDHPETRASDAIRQSKQMMNGFKWKKFCLGWRFLGWALLGILTCGIGWLWLYPYIMTSNAHFYDDIRNGA